MTKPARAAIDLTSMPTCDWISGDGEWAAFSDGAIVPVVNWVTRFGEPLVPEQLNAVTDKSRAFVCRHPDGWVLIELAEMPEYMEH